MWNYPPSHAIIKISSQLACARAFTVWLMILMQGFTPLMYAVKGGHWDTVRELMKYKPDLRCDYQNKVSILMSLPFMQFLCNFCVVFRSLFVKTIKVSQHYSLHSAICWLVTSASTVLVWYQCNLKVTSSLLQCLWVWLPVCRSTKVLDTSKDAVADLGVVSWVHLPERLS